MSDSPSADKTKRTKPITLRAGLGLYKQSKSRFWFVRIHLGGGKFVRKSTKEESRFLAQEIAYEIYDDVMRNRRKYTKIVPASSFTTLAKKLIENQQDLVGTTRSDRYVKDDLFYLERKTDGLIVYFGDKDITEITTSKIREYFKVLDQNRVKPLAHSTKNRHLVLIRKILKLGSEEGFINNIPQLPKFEVKDKPRVSFTETEYKKFLKGIRDAVKRSDTVRGNKITLEYYYFIVLSVHSYLRPTNTEAYALKRGDIEFSEKDKTLELDINGKTGRRKTTSTTVAPEIYEKLLDCNPEYNKSSDYIFQPDRKNRETVKRIAQRFFNHILQCVDLKTDKDGNPRVPYSLRHYSLQSRLRTSGGEVNIFHLAKNAGTSVDQLERFYLKHTGLSSKEKKKLNYIA
jgi:hypothetical protein